MQGWYQVAFERDLASGLTPIETGRAALLAVREPGRLRLVDAACPHRGASLAGGRLEGGKIVCPFHGHSVQIGGEKKKNKGGFCVKAHHMLSVGGLVFTRANGGPGNGFEEALRALDQDHLLVPGFELIVATARPSLVIENAFDAAHFVPVHHVCRAPKFDLFTGPSGEVGARGELEVPRSAWQQTGSARARVPFEVRAYSAGLAISTLGGANPYSVLTGATPRGENATTVRLSLAFPRSAGVPDDALVAYLLASSRRGLEADAVIWSTMLHDDPEDLVAGDEGVVAYRKACERWRLSA